MRQKKTVVGMYIGRTEYPAIKGVGGIVLNVNSFATMTRYHLVSQLTKNVSLKVPDGTLRRVPGVPVAPVVPTVNYHWHFKHNIMCVLRLSTHM